MMPESRAPAGRFPVDVVVACPRPDGLEEPHPWSTRRFKRRGIPTPTLEERQRPDKPNTDMNVRRHQAAIVQLRRPPVPSAVERRIILTAAA